MKFSIGQNVKLTMDNPWIGEYEIDALIIGFGNVYLNGIPTYKLKTKEDKIYDCISENRLK